MKKALCLLIAVLLGLLCGCADPSTYGAQIENPYVRSSDVSSRPGPYEKDSLESWLQSGSGLVMVIAAVTGDTAERYMEDAQTPLPPVDFTPIRVEKLITVKDEDIPETGDGFVMADTYRGRVPELREGDRFAVLCIYNNAYEGYSPYAGADSFFFITDKNRVFPYTDKESFAQYNNMPLKTFEKNVEAMMNP